MISAVVITKNEEKNIARCLASLNFCSEIIVIDSFSSDRTREIARLFTSYVFEQEWLGYATQRNYGLMQSQNEWTLSIDADEWVSPELAKEISDAVTAPDSPYSAYALPRKNIHFSRWIKHGGWYPNHLVRLFKKSEGEWAGNELHEYWNTTGKVGRLNEPLVHYSFANLAEQVEKNNRYSTLGAEKLSSRGYRFTLLNLWIKPVIKFVETYFLKKGFLDGLPGFIISVSAAYSVFLKWAKLWEMKHCGNSETKKTS